jgi:S1-C subfamily serine protease
MINRLVPREPHLLFALSFFLILACCVHTVNASELTEEELNTIAIYEKVAPSVVNITTMVCDPEFFVCPVPPSSGSGSGIVLKEEGVIVTNHHVIAGAQNIQVTLSDGRHLKAKVVASSPDMDLAILQIDIGDSPLTAIEMGDSSDVKVGEKVMAIGNPFGLGQTLTVGTVSMVGRHIRDENRTMRDLIQTDASINPGNSGGALVNSQGKLIGMNTIILSPTGSSIGIGFAIPVNQINEAAPTLLSDRNRWLGVLLVILIVYWIIYRYRMYRR